MSNERRVELRPVRWEAAVLVCKECRRRKNGPRDLKTKVTIHELKAAGVTHVGPRTRIVQTKCLGVCPKNAMTIALLGGGAPTMGLVGSRDDARRIASQLKERLAVRPDGA